MNQIRPNPKKEKKERALCAPSSQDDYGREEKKIPPGIF
jgi:hypothetical protein